MAFSYWEDEAWLKGRDAVVIGGGIVGLSAACRLVELRPHWRIGVLERSAFGDGGTTRNAGFACFGSPAELMDDRRALGDAAAIALVRRRLAGLAALRRWLGDAAIGYEACGSHALYVEGGLPVVPESDLRDLNRWLQPATGRAATFSRVALPSGRGLDAAAAFAADASPLEGAVNTGLLHRALVAAAARSGVDVVRGVDVAGIEGGARVRLAVRRGSEGPLHTVETPRCLVATNAFARELIPGIDARPAANRVLVTAPIPDLVGTAGTYHFEAGYVYARHLPEGRLLIGGGRHWGLGPEATEARLLEWLHGMWPASRKVSVAYAWTGWLGVGDVREPLLREVHPGCIAAVRLGGMGVAIGTGLGWEAAELLAKSR